MQLLPRAEMEAAGLSLATEMTARLQATQMHAVATYTAKVFGATQGLMHQVITSSC